MGGAISSRQRQGFSLRALVCATLAFACAIGVLHYACLAHYPKAELDIYNLSDFYPLSVFKFRKPQPSELALAALGEVMFVLVWRRTSARPAGLIWLFLAALGFSVLSNLLHGWRYGIDFPTATSGDSGIEYFHDAVLIPGPLWFLRRFNAIQFELLEHARTHPPGPVLFYYALHRLLRNPGLVSIAVSAISLGVSLPYLRRLLVQGFGSAPASALLLYALLPAVLIYDLAVVDAPIAALLLAAICHYIDDRPHAALLAALFFALALFFTFGALFLVPVFLGFEFVRRRRVSRSLLVFLLSALLIASLKPLFGYGWLASFLKAARMENEQGFLLFANARRYLWYRLGAVGEILFFFSPFLCLLAWRGFSALRRASADLFALAWLGPLSLACMLLSGAMKIGEAARVCLFILPYLLLPVFAAWRSLTDGERFRVAQAVFGFGLVLQLFGFYQW